MFRDQTKQTVKRHKYKPAVRDVSIAVQIPNRPMSPGLEAMGVNYFLRQFVNGGSAHSRGCLNYIPSSYSLDADNPALLKSMAAVGLIALAKSTSNFELAESAQTKYLDAVRMVNAALQTPVKSTEDGTLMAVISLGVFEEISDYESWLLHVQGAAALLVARGKGQFSSPLSMRLFNQVRADLITACVNENKPVPEEILQLQEAGSTHPDASTSFWQIGVLGVRCAKLLTKFKSYNIGMEWELLEEATILEEDFKIVGQRLSLEEPYSTLEDPGGGPDLTRHGRIGVYKDMWAIRIWNNWRNLLMIVCRIKCFVLNKLLAHGLPVDAVARMRLQLRDAMSLLSQLGTNILATLPQAMEFQMPCARIPLDNKRDLPLSNVAGAYLLAARLSVVGQSEATTSETRQWIIQRLRDISNTARIPTAVRIIEDIQAVEAKQLT